MVLTSLCWLMPAGAQTPNLAVNPGFEEWPPPTPAAGVWAATSYSIGVEGRDGSAAGRAYRTGEGELDTERHSGRYAQYLQTTTWGRGAIARGVPVTSGHRYRIAVWTKVLSGKFQLGVCFAHAPWTYLGDWEYAQPGGQWARVTKEITIPEGCQSLATVMFLQTGSAYLDDLEIVDLGRSEATDPAADQMPLLRGRLATQITRKRVALFSEPDFPSESPRSTDWYTAVLKGAGLEVTSLDCRALCEPASFSRERFDTLILPTGGNFPTAAEAAVERFLGQGGTLVVDENMVLRTASAPADETARELERRRQDYLAGKGGYAYWDYLARHLWAAWGNMLEWNAQERTWHSTMNRSQNYEYLNPAYYPEGLGLRPWPNTGQPSYARPLSTPLQRNAGLDAVLADWPATVPADAQPSAARGALRLCRQGNQAVETGVAAEHAGDLLLSLYSFADPSGLNYPGFPEAGKSPRDREGDCYVLRYHNARLEGGTLLHFGSVGARLLAGPKGEAVLLASLRLAESELPGECPPEYIRTANEARDTFSRYAGQSLACRALLTEAAAVATYANQAAEAAAAKQTFSQEHERFEALSTRADEAERVLAKRDGDLAYGQRARRALVADLQAEVARLDAALADLRAHLKPALNPPAAVPVKSPFGHLYFGLDNTDARGALGLAEFRKLVEQMGLRYEGYHLTSYRHEYTFNGHPFKREFDSGVLDPVTGVVTPRKDRWPETAEDQQRWQESFRWQLERVNKDPQTTSIYGMDERDFEWSLWGARDRLLFLEYLQKKYGDTGKLNAVWATKHGSFEDIQLPTARPQTQSEHACWEDWTRFREVYRLEREIRLSTEAVLRYAPDREWRYLTWCTYNQHGVQPANGINFYEYGKELPVNGFEHSNEDAKEWLAFDICSMFSKHCTAEWGAFYFPPATHQARVDLLQERLWKGLANGQAGWSLFTFSAPRWPASNYVDLMNRPLPPGWQLAEIKRRADAIEHILLDGTREEPPVRLVYSPTTRRHTSWPNVESDISYRATGGLYTLFRNSHLHARAIDEQAVWEGHLPRECRLLILSEVLYQNQALQAKVSDYLRAGGNVLVTPGSGRFDHYGRPQASWLKLAGVVPQPVTEKVIPLTDGLRYFSAAHADKMVALQPVFPDEVQVLARYATGEAALTQTKVGQGKLFVVGCNLGLDAHDQYQGNPAPVRALLAPVLQAAGITQEVEMSRQDIMVRPWQHQGKRYVVLASTGREGISDYTLSVPGHWEVRDYLLGVSIPVTHRQGRTHLSGTIGSPGGAVLALSPAAGKPAEGPTAPPAPHVVLPAVPPAPAPARLDEQTPFEGRLWARDGTIRLGDFALQLDVETGGGWGGACFLSARLGKEQLRKRCVAGETAAFYFTARILRVECREVTSVYPSNVLTRVTVSPRRVEAADCRLVREDYYGQQSLVLTNGLLRARLLPRLGGRLIELTTLPDETPHLCANPELMKQGLGSAWADFGGMEENAGGWPGPYWNADFAVEVVEETPERIVVRLAMKQAVEWAYGYADPKSGRNRLVKEFSLRRGDSRVEVQLQAFNEGAAAMPVGLRTHPVWRIGGDGGPGDHWLFGRDGKTADRPYPFPDTVPAEGDWTALVDRPKRVTLVQAYDPAAVATLYTHAPPGHYGLELVARVREVPVGQGLPLAHSLSLIQGLGGLDAWRNGLALHVDTGGKSSLGKDEALACDVEMGSTRAREGGLIVEVWQDAKPVAALGSATLSLQPGLAATQSFSWKPGGLPDADYEIVARFTGKGDKSLEARRTIRLSRAGRQSALEGLAAYEGQIAALKQQYLRTRGGRASQEQAEALRERTVAAALLLSELRSLIATGQLRESQEMEQRLRVLLGRRTGG